jgi:hypothetical protein
VVTGACDPLAQIAEVPQHFANLILDVEREIGDILFGKARVEAERVESAQRAT